MAFDGIVVAGLVHELKQKLTDGRIAKIAQPEADELLLTIKSPCRTTSAFNLSKRFSSAYLSYRHK